MGKEKVHLTYTEEELKYFKKRAAKRNKTLTASLHEDLINAFRGIPEGDLSIPSANNKQDMFFDIPPRIWKILYAVSLRLGIRPGELVYRVVIAPHLIEIIKEKDLEAEALAAD